MVTRGPNGNARPRKGFRKSLGEYLFDGFNVVLLSALMLITLYPFYYVLMGSLSDPAAFQRHQGLLLAPQGFSLGAYHAVWANPSIRTGYINTLFCVVVGTALNMLLTIFGAYGLTRKNLWLRRPVLLLIVFTLYFGGGLVPVFC